MESNTNLLEFNSNARVIDRCNRIIDAINESRFRTTEKDETETPYAEAEEYLSHIISLYMEICVELNKTTDDNMWEKLTRLRDRLRIFPPKPSFEKMSYWKKSIAEIDDLQREVRKLAKQHGFLSSNKDDPNLAVLKT